jgi:NADH dehydrogenase FAD-containing subunit
MSVGVGPVVIVISPRTHYRRVKARSTIAEVVGTGERCRPPHMGQPAKATTVTIIGAGLGGIALVAKSRGSRRSSS